MPLSILELPDDILLHLLEYFFIPLDPTSQLLGPYHVKLFGRSSDTLGSLSLTCHRFASISRDIIFRDLRLKNTFCQQDLQILRSIGSHIKRLALEIQAGEVDLANIIEPLDRLQSLHLTHGFDLVKHSPDYGDLKTYPQIAHLSVDHGLSLSHLLYALPGLRTLQLSPCRGISSEWPVHPGLCRLKLFSIPASFGPVETRVLILSFPGIKEFEARFLKVSTKELECRWNHTSLHEWLGPILALPISRLTFGYFSTQAYRDDVINISHMLAQRSVTLESLTWRQHRLGMQTGTRRIADLLVADNKPIWELWVVGFEVLRGQRETKVAMVKEYKIC